MTRRLEKTQNLSKFSLFSRIKCKKIIQILTGKNVDLVIPFEDMTKAEVISISPYKEHLKDSHSCVSQLYRRPDGTCYGCVIRKLGMILGPNLLQKIGFDK